MWRFYVTVPDKRLREMVNKSTDDCVVCVQEKARRRPHPDSCRPFNIFFFPFSSIATAQAGCSVHPEICQPPPPPIPAQNGGGGCNGTSSPPSGPKSRTKWWKARDPEISHPRVFFLVRKGAMKLSFWNTRVHKCSISGEARRFFGRKGLFAHACLFCGGPLWQGQYGGF